MVFKVDNKWHDIWNSKPVIEEDLHGDEYEMFKRLKRCNGFDVAVENTEEYYTAFYLEWKSFYERVMACCKQSIDSVFEVGCGCGVNLFMFQNRAKHNIEVGGCDYSPSMTESARLLTHGADFACCEAIDICVSPKYNVVMSESVFQYFNSLDYAENVLRKMLDKSNKLVYVGEIHNKEYEKELLEYRRKTIADYEEKYKGLSKQFYSKEWFENIAKQYGKSVEFTAVDNPQYINGKYLFNCYIY